LPAGWSDLNRAPMIVREIDVEGALVFGDTHVHQAFGAIELGLP
jgi:hypothetical protein